MRKRLFDLIPHWPAADPRSAKTRARGFCCPAAGEPVRRVPPHSLRAGIFLVLPLVGAAAQAPPPPSTSGASLLPLPPAPVVLVADAPALDRALSGGFRKALEGALPENDPVAGALRRTRVGGKLESQWDLFAKDLPLSWKQIMSLQPTALGISILSAGELEAVLAVRTPLAELPLKLPGGRAATYRGASYRVVSPGAGDDRTAARRMGLAWARVSGTLLLATSERALKLALDRSLAGEGFSAFSPGLASVKLDLPALRKDLYFRREFLFAEGLAGPEEGALVAALRLEGNDLVEIREGTAKPAADAPTWNVAGRPVVGAGWEVTPDRFFAALRRGILEPVPSPAEKPVAALKPLPDPAGGAQDRYLVDLRQPEAVEASSGEPGELPRWAQLLQTPPLQGWGWEVLRNGARRLVIRRPADGDAAFAELVAQTAARRAGRVSATENSVLVGPDLPAVAWRRTGPWLWIASRVEDLADLPEPTTIKGLVRWGQLDLSEVRKLGKAWASAEGAFSPETVRPFSDRILGLLGWAPGTASIRVERRQEGERFTERVVFKAAELKAPAAPKAPPAAKKPARRPAKKT